MNKQKLIVALAVVVLSVGLFSYTQYGRSNQAAVTADTADNKSAPRRHQTTGVVSVDIKEHNGTLHLLLGKNEQGQHSVWHQTSTDQGQTWSEAVNTTADLDISAKFHRGNDARLAVQTDNLVAVWMSRVEGAPHNAGPMMSVRSSDAGKSWQAATMPADWNGPHGFFAMDGNDEKISLVWLDSREQVGKGSQGLRYTSSIDGGQTWLENKTLDRQTCACCWNTARFDEQGQLYVLYRDKLPSDMAVGQVNKQDEWQRLSTVGAFNWDFQGCPHIGGSLAFDETGQLFHATVSTGEESKAGVHYLNSADQGQHWNAPVQLGSDTAVHSDLAVTAGGQLLATWDYITENGFEVVYATSSDQGKTWTEQQKLSGEGLRASHPRVVAVDDAFLVIWTQTNTDNVQELQTKLIRHDS